LGTNAITDPILDEQAWGGVWWQWGFGDDDGDWRCRTLDRYGMEKMLIDLIT